MFCPLLIILNYFLFFISLNSFSFFFFFNDTATTEIYTLSLHDALPISVLTLNSALLPSGMDSEILPLTVFREIKGVPRSEEHTSELQSLRHLVCRLLLEKKKKEFIIEGDQRTERAIIVNTLIGDSKDLR